MLEVCHHSRGHNFAPVRAWNLHQGEFLEGSTLIQDAQESDGQRMSRLVLAMGDLATRQGSVEADERLGRRGVVDSGIEDQQD